MGSKLKEREVEGENRNSKKINRKKKTVNGIIRIRHKVGESTTDDLEIKHTRKKYLQHLLVEEEVMNFHQVSVDSMTVATTRIQ